MRPIDRLAPDVRSDVWLPLLVSFGADKISATHFLIELLSEVVKSASDTPMTTVIERAKTVESERPLELQTFAAHLVGMK